MTKQEFLAFSLGKGLVLQSPYGFRPNSKESTGIYRLVYLTGDMYADIENKTFPEEFIPILRPLSDLTKEIEHNGEKFVPIARIYNMSGHYEIGRNWFKQNNIECLPFFIMQYLIKNHFDIADLITKGEAIDVNILDINPYK